VDRLQVPDSAGAAGTAVAVPVSSVRTALAEEAGLRTYEVQQGDSLSRIAEKVYGDPTQWPRIRDANRDKVRDERVRAGQVLVIP
jgi:nucleoid-associated protein YgaU